MSTYPRSDGDAPRVTIHTPTCGIVIQLIVHLEDDDLLCIAKDLH